MRRVSGEGAKKGRRGLVRVRVGVGVRIMARASVSVRVRVGLGLALGVGVRDRARVWVRVRVRVSESLTLTLTLTRSSRRPPLRPRALRRPRPTPQTASCGRVRQRRAGALGNARVTSTGSTARRTGAR